MELYLDTANIDEIKTYAAWGIVDGVTTNPTLASKEKVKYRDRLKEIVKVIKGPVSAEVIGLTADEMVKEGMGLAAIAKNIYVKVPLTPEGLQACSRLRKKGIGVNVTLCFSASQALLAAKAGASFVSPFEGRLDDLSQDSLVLIEEIRAIFDNYQFSTKILAASIRSPRQVTEAAMVGADIATMPAKIFDQLVSHPLTDIGIEKFLADWKKCKNC